MASTPLPSVSRRGALAFALGGALGCKATPYREVEVDLTGAAPPRAPDGTRRPAFRFAVAAMQSPRNTYASYATLFSRVARLVGVELEFVQRRSYGEVNALLLGGSLEAAYLCTGGYLSVRRRAPGRVEVLAVPVIRGKTTYESVVIVPSTAPARSLRDLAGKRFAFTDELSLSGHLYPAYALREAGEEPTRFFADVIYTHSHDRAIDAVSTGAVDGAAVDGLVYEDLVARDDSVGVRTRIIQRSPPLGIMPIVAAPHISAELRAHFREALLGLDRDAEAAASLRAIRIDRFVVPAPDLYDAAALMVSGG